MYQSFISNQTTGNCMNVCISNPLLYSGISERQLELKWSTIDAFSLYFLSDFEKILLTIL